MASDTGETLDKIVNGRGSGNTGGNDSDRNHTGAGFLLFQKGSFVGQEGPSDGSLPRQWEYNYGTMANQRTEKKTKGAAAAPARTPNNLVVFLVGAFGGVAPTLLRFAIDLSQQRSTVAALNSSVLLGIALFGLLGGGVAAIWQEIDLKKVFYIGLGLPSLLTVIASSATAPKAGLAEYRPVNGKVLAFGGGTEPVLLRLAASAGTSRLKVIFPPEVSYTNGEVVFKLRNEGYEARSLDRDREVIVPNGAVAVTIITPIAQSAVLNVLIEGSGAFMTVMEFTASKDRWAGFLYAIGAHTKPYMLKLVNSKTSPLAPLPGPKPV